MNMKTFKIRLMQNVKRWYAMPLDTEVEATDLATAITLAWDRAKRNGLMINEFHLLT